MGDRDGRDGARFRRRIGTAPSAHLEGIDFAGKTGSAQVVSNEAKSRLGGGKALRDNAWFVGVSPRRNPEIVVCTLMEGGEHGKLAARVAAQVIEAYVNKQRKARQQSAGGEAAPGSGRSGRDMVGDAEWATSRPRCVGGTSS